MHFELTTEQNMLVETARKVGGQFGLDYWRDLDGKKEFPAAFWREACNAGLCGVALPEAYGGSGLGMLEMALTVETLCAAGGGSTLSNLYLLNPIFGGVSVNRAGSPAQKVAMLPGLSSGEIMFCMALTEPDVGSNTPRMKTFAAADGDGWRVNGEKTWITGVPQSNKILLAARTKKFEDVRRKTDGISLFAIDTQREGIAHAQIDKLGTNTLSASTIFFSDVRIEPHELLGELDRGWSTLVDVLNTERIVTTAGLIGTAELAIRIAVNYAKERSVFSGPIGAYQSIQFPLSEALIKLECARLMNYKAATLFDRGLPNGSEANMAKWLAGQAAAVATDRAIQTLGGMGYAKEYHVERLWRDARLFRIAPVSEEMILNYIAQHDLGLPRSY
jgi:acyl-CoA dehydrogenase